MSNSPGPDTSAAASARLSAQAPALPGAPVGKQRWAWLKHLWAKPDPDLVDAGLRGEWLIAGLRLLMLVLLLYVPLQRYLQNPAEPGHRMMLWLVAAALAEALVIYSAVRRSWGRKWIGFFSGILDVSLVSLGLWIFFRLGRPLEALDDPLLFPIYLLAIAATSLRYDWRICVLTGLTALLEYSGLLAYAMWQWELSAELYSPRLQGSRLLLLLLSTLLSTVLVFRSSEQRSRSNRDRLTGLFNRGFFDENLIRLAAVALRTEQSVTVAMMDLDRFKRLNDTHGHHVGDLGLRHVAEILSGSVRSTDLVARYGGEEFACLFLGMRHEDAHRRLEDLREKIAGSPLIIDGKGRRATLTLSIGMAIWPSEGEDLKAALKIADQRLYQAKRAGRNRVAGPNGQVG